MTLTEDLAHVLAMVEHQRELSSAPSPFELVDGELQRRDGYVVVMRNRITQAPRLIVRMEEVFGEATEEWIACADKIETRILHVTVKRCVLSRNRAEALFADVCADLRRGGKVMRQWCEALPFQVILAKATRAEALRSPPEYVPRLYASAPRWIHTKERPADETP